MRTPHYPIIGFVHILPMNFFYKLQKLASTNISCYWQWH